MAQPASFRYTTTDPDLRVRFRWAVFVLSVFSLSLITTFAFAVQAVRSGPIDNIKNFFKKPAASSTVVNEPVRIVSEESQVVDVIKQATGAVVSIIASGDVPILEECEDGEMGTQTQKQDTPEDFRDFFDLPDLCEKGTTRQRIGAGSGFLVSSDGYILTNKHVVSNDKATYTVVLNDDHHAGQKLAAQVAVRDPNNDIAILKVNTTNVPYLQFSDSSNLQVGQTAVAIGYALGEFENTVSKGVVSGLARSVEASGEDGDPEHLRGLIQTDAAINPGNSGGPLLDISGKVIGMNVAMADLAQSIGFAIPSNVIRAAYDEVRATGQIKEVEHAYLGVRYTPMTLDYQNKNKLPFDYGMIVTSTPGSYEAAVITSSPAETAGLVANDIILEANGKQLNDRYLLSDFIIEQKPGDKADFKIYRNGVTLTLPVTLGKR